MFSLFSASQLWMIVLFAVLFYLLIVAVAYGRHYLIAGTKIAAPATAAKAESPVLLGVAKVLTPIPSASVRPAVVPARLESLAHDDDEEEDDLLDFDADFPLVEEQQATLLKEAERVVEQIQTVVNNIESRPANPEEVFTKIQAVVKEYSFFFETDYYDAINRFVAVTVQRECDLLLSEDDLKALWYAAAA